MELGGNSELNANVQLFSKTIPLLYIHKQLMSNHLFFHDDIKRNKQIMKEKKQFKQIQSSILASYDEHFNIGKYRSYLVCVLNIRSTYESKGGLHLYLFSPAPFPHLKLVTPRCGFSKEFLIWCNCIIFQIIRSIHRCVSFNVTQCMRTKNYLDLLFIHTHKNTFLKFHLI